MLNHVYKNKRGKNTTEKLWNCDKTRNSNKQLKTESNKSQEDVQKDP